ATATRGGSNDGCERVQVRAARDVRPARGIVVRDGGVPDVDVMVFGCHAATAGGSGVLDNCGVVDAQLAILDVNGAAAAAGGVARERRAVYQHLGKRRIVSQLGRGDHQPSA